MKNKTILFVCVLIVLSINLQCNISVCAQIENNEAIVEEGKIDLLGEDITDTDTDDKVIEGTSISSEVDEQEQEYLSN